MTEELLDQYLWDGSGEPDEQVAHLERLLARFRHSASLTPASADSEVEADREPPA